MARVNKWWTLCAFSLSCVVLFGSARRVREADGAQPELFIFNELCALKDEPGPCKAIKDRYFFSVDTGRCEPFEYGGCGGNANNFETPEACEEMCIVSDEKNPCHLPEAPGPCRGLLTRYFFDSETQQCKHFYYGGCFGNANNFQSMAGCQARCQDPPGQPNKAPEVQPQSAAKDVVVVVVDQPAVVTDWKRSELCFSPVERGPCYDTERRFAYNPNTRRCQMFHYSGCGGNENNFTYRKDCIIKCIRNRKAHGKKMIRIRKKNAENLLQHAA
ncbi:tissue factor pathway inhibitor a isoform X2 [Brachionichthys hirsutus]|uniref:tissue factor pathway inhibitor a isoform X2 n=1 Tax=Brachionichthys hirsutus TaxID=412623 RepID=UPI003604D070